MVTYSLPNDSDPNFRVAVDQPMPHTRDVAPGDFRIAFAKRRGDFAGGLADYLERSDHCILVQAARQKLGPVETFDKADGFFGRELHIQ